MNNRALSIDALRGYAIITMVLSATVVYGVLPGWMYHAQVPPPDHIFNPNLPGLTWVDMVFPSFLFALGAALPFSVGKKYEKGQSKFSLAVNALWRGVKLTFFAILIQHFYPFMTSSPQDMSSWLLALFCFALLFPMYMRLPWEMPSWARTAIQLGAMAIGAIVMLNIEYPNGYSFNPHTSNIIILILANVAVFATLLYIVTIGHPFWRIGILALLAALFFSSDYDPDCWQHAVMHWSPLDWFYNPLYLKYLFLVMPGCYAGEILSSWYKARKECPEAAAPDHHEKSVALPLLIISLEVVITNLCFLYARNLELNLACSAVLIVIGWLLTRKGEGYVALWRKLLIFGGFMLMLGLFFEGYEGGIKKDPVNFTYLFTTAGLSFMTLIFFSIICDYYQCHRSTSFLVLSGQNPMVA
ncbi:MAG: DUF5009 domain-containing protein, partial [Muribaculaceae bacterium]